MPKYQSAQIEAFRQGIEMLLMHYAEATRLAIKKNAAIGMKAAGLKDMRESDRTKWAAQRTILERDIKRHVAGLISLMHSVGYQRNYTK